MLKHRLRDMVKCYNQQNRIGAFRSGTSEQYKEKAWKLLQEFVETSTAATEQARQSKAEKQRKKEITVKKVCVCVSE